MRQGRACRYLTSCVGDSESRVRGRRLSAAVIPSLLWLWRYRHDGDHQFLTTKVVGPEMVRAAAAGGEFERL